LPKLVNGWNWRRTRNAVGVSKPSTETESLFRYLYIYHLKLFKMILNF